MVNTGGIQLSPSPKARLNDFPSLGRVSGVETFSCCRSPWGGGGGGVQLPRYFLMSAKVCGPRMSLWALGGQHSGSQLSNGSAAAHNTDVNVELEEQCIVLTQSRNLMFVGSEF